MTRAPIIAATALLAAIVGVGVVGATGNESADPIPSSATVEPFTPAPTAETTTTTVAPTTTPPIPKLTNNLFEGVQGPEVRALQKRLSKLGFDPGPVDGIFGQLTTQAVWAFEKLVLGTPRAEATGVIDRAAWKVLMDDVEIAPRRSTDGQADHTEVYLEEQVLIVFHKDVPRLITHISSGQLDENGDPEEYCEEATYDTDAQGRELEEPVTKAVCALAKTPGGVFSYDRQVEGTRVSPLGAMWNPVYFNYGIAVHGALNVPLEPVSHGCVRLPMHISEYYQDIIEIGDRILVWNGTDEPEDVSEQESLPSFDYPDPNATTTTVAPSLPPETTSVDVPSEESTPEAEPPTSESAATATTLAPESSAPTEDDGADEGADDDTEG